MGVGKAETATVGSCEVVGATVGTMVGVLDGCGDPSDGKQADSCDSRRTPTRAVSIVPSASEVNSHSSITTSYAELVSVADTDRDG